ncbi:hypothetical protein [Mangrovimonas cancribranchiae]|uniref:Uncharacterized protein n=1 Tax=Mangrovimonas cancribranchiae TaxID=3080055 RepID=A0AAU6P6F8_9FLAO
MKYLKCININKFIELTPFQQVQVFIENGFFEIENKHLEFVKNKINHLKQEGTLDSKLLITETDYIKWNKELGLEIAKHINDNIHNYNTSVFIELINDYESVIILNDTIDYKKSIIKDYLVKLHKEFYAIWCHSWGFEINPNSITLNGLKLWTEQVYSGLQFYDNHEEGNYILIRELLRDVKRDIIQYLINEGDSEFVTYQGFSAILHDYIKYKNKLNDEYNSLIHKEKAMHGESTPLNINKYPRVFKDISGLNLFINLVAKNPKPKKIDFTYYFEIFKTEKILIKKVKISDYIFFVNDYYPQISFNRLRKNDFKHEDYNKHLKALLKIQEKPTS